MKINFFYDEVFPGAIVNAIVIRRKIKNLLKIERKKLGEINITFTHNQRILEINRKFLNHNYFTDVITFGDCIKNLVSGDLLISVDQVEINAKKYRIGVEVEMMRVILHGILHLIGYNDSNEEEIRIIRNKEDMYLCDE